MPEYIPPSNERYLTETVIGSSVKACRNKPRVVPPPEMVVSAGLGVHRRAQSPNEKPQSPSMVRLCGSEVA